ncbi:MAG TPA: hypothetical protein VGA61_11170 [Anaerolineae bacterium]
MDTLNVEALDSLQALLTSLLPAPADPAFKPALLIVPLRFAPVGMGSYVGFFPGTDTTPAGDLYGRRIQARVLVTARAATLDNLDAVVTAVTRGFLSNDRTELARRGLLTLALDQVGPRPAEPPTSTPARDIAFSVLFEYVKTPAAAGDTIARIDVNLRDPDDPAPLPDKRVLETREITKDNP